MRPFTAAGSKDDDWIAFNLRTATLGKNHYMNAVQTFDSNGAVEGGLKNANIPVLYSFGRHHTLTLYMLDEAKVTKAIQDRKIEPSMLVEGAEMIAGARVIAEVTESSAVLNY